MLVTSHKVRILQERPSSHRIYHVQDTRDIAPSPNKNFMILISWKYVKNKFFLAGSKR